MPVTNEWLAGPTPSKRLDRALLEERILNLLSSQNMCVLATSGPDGPLATPVRYFHLDFTLLFTAVATSPKMRNLASDPRISVGVFAPLVGQASSRGAQIFGRARVLEAGDPGFERFWPAYRWQSDHVERSRSLDEPPTGPLTVVEADRIVYTEHWLRRQGYAPRQEWHADAAQMPFGGGGNRAGLRDVVLDVLGERDIPVLAQVEFGHTSPNLPLPLGVRADLDADNRTLSLLEPAVTKG